MDTDYKVLYRKYRPSSFDEVVGQKYTIEMLKNAIINDKLSHAYIFTGPRGTGKTSTAKIFAKTINCEHHEQGVPCGTCSSCQNINQNADIIEIDAASNTGVDEIRELINNVKVSPSFSKYKVYIIDEVHMLSQSAFNALLLTLEEPPAHIIFILATTNIESVPITILSRCQRYDFKKINDNDIFNHLKIICEKENIDITDEALQEIAYLSDGGLRDALSILNQLSTSVSSITLDSVLDNYGSVSLVQIKAIINALFTNNYEKMKEIFDNLNKTSIDYKTFIKKTIDELYIMAIRFKKENKNENYSIVKKIVFELNDLINKINLNIDPFLLIFMIFIDNMQFTDVNLKENEKDVKEKDDFPIESELENKVVIGSQSDFSQENKELDAFLEKLLPIRINNCFAEADKIHLNEAKDLWGKFITNVSSPDLKQLLIDCKVVLASVNINILVSSQESITERFNRKLNVIEAEYNKLLGKKVAFIALLENVWENKKKEYIEKLKSGVKYILQEEPEYYKKEKKAETKEENNSECYSSDIMDIFDQDKIEIQ